jgi:hypothetical protein
MILTMLYKKQMTEFTIKAQLEVRMPQDISQKHRKLLMSGKQTIQQTFTLLKV